MLDPRIQALIEKSEQDGGLFLKHTMPGDKILVQTLNTLYTVVHGTDGKFVIQGHAHYCPAPTQAVIMGSTWGGSMLKVGFIGINMHLEFAINGMLITTSPIKSVVLADQQVH